MSEDAKDVAKEIAKEVAKKSKPKRSLLGWLRIVGLAIATVLVVIIAINNWKTTKLNLLGTPFEMPLAVLMILIFVCGIGVGLLLAFLRPWRKNKG